MQQEQQQQTFYCYILYYGTPFYTNEENVPLNSTFIFPVLTQIYHDESLAFEWAERNKELKKSNRFEKNDFPDCGSEIEVYDVRIWLNLINPFFV